MTSETIAQIRNEAAASLSPEQQQWEQFLTPMPVAEQAVSLFTPTDRPVRILDLGSGSGILSAVVAGQSAAGSSVVASEQDADLAAASESSLRQVCDDVTVINDSVFNVMLDDQYGGGKHAWAGGRETRWCWFPASLTARSCNGILLGSRGRQRHGAPTPPTI